MAIFTGENEYLGAITSRLPNQQIMNSTKQVDSKRTLGFLYLSITLID